MKKVVVLMSSYNGSRYIRQQLDSILAQQGIEIEVYIRDDGSTDDTPAIIKEYQSANDNVFLIEGANMGAWRSFLELLRETDEQADYYAFADQDDEWMPDKLLAAVHSLEKAAKTYGDNIPLLYCSNKILCNENLEPVDAEINYDKQYVPSLGNALVQNICTGCTAVMNMQLRDIINSVTPEYIFMHDWWLYLIAVYFGRVVYDREPHMKYRLHGRNAHGTQISKIGLIKHRLKELSKPRGEVYRQAEVFRECFNLENTLIDDFIASKENFSARVRIVRGNQVRRQDEKDSLMNKLLLLTGKA